MQVISLTEARNNLKAVFDTMKETNYLLSSRANAKHLQESIKQLREGKVVHKTVEELID